MATVCVGCVDPSSPPKDCWSCPTIQNRIKVTEFLFRKNIKMTAQLKDLIAKYAEYLKSSYGGDYVFKIMDFCGTHEWTIVHFGLRSLVPKNVELVPGPGCPVCVVPSYYIEEAIKLALDGVAIYTYGDAYKLPAIRPVKGVKSLAEAKAQGADVKVVSHILQAISLASHNKKPGVFLGIGFETVAPGYAVAVLDGKIPENLKVMSLVKLTPPAAYLAIDTIREKPTDFPIMGVIAPGHVSTIIGAKAWTPIAENFGIPVVVAGFEPNDVLFAIAEILRQLKSGESKVVIEYTRAVTWDGDLKAQAAIRKVFKTVDTAWRGIGFIPKSGLALREEYANIDAMLHFGIPELKPEAWRRDLPLNCRCAEVNLGKAKPTDCPLFMKACTPDRPIGPCMVSMEGACAVWARFGGGGLAEDVARELGII